ncbi:aminopeptidase PepB [Microbulbifer spongiae]|uniref:Aminopeptidase PepB n=1 Tax=Microbulbifer spongiae TaxID=2944933 RepID=A0ABY9ED60_9GAMM|nr:aminopeptidase PepB [Microbulbifer sp. MI-G]WKD49310.1 aminopeptidase PepB [Microbulbifer sp. MI-G]
MSKVMRVQLVEGTAGAPWGTSALLSFNGSDARIHIGAAKGDALIAAQRAARRLDGLGVSAVVLSGEGWDIERRWAFWMGYFNPKAANRIDWGSEDVGERKELAARESAARWVREITNGTPDGVSPRVLAESAAEMLQKLAPDAVRYHMIAGEDLLREGFVGIHSVGRGSAREPVMLQLDYNPSGDAAAPVDTCLVGKGITFDSGGYSLKPSANMATMKSDMGGAAMVSGGLALAIARGLNKRVKLYLCCAENLVSGHAYKLGDIIQYKNGVAVEVLNTDAEGRLVLADGLIAASEAEPRWLLDAATLTGAAKVAVGREFNAVFSFEAAMAQRVLDAAGRENEKAWRLPLEPMHLEQIPSGFADIANIGADGSPGASTAAAFLAHFVRDAGRNWVHMDLSGSYQPSANALWATGAKGQGLRTIARFLLDS